MRYLVDTNVLSEVMRKQPDPQVLEWFGGLERIALSVVTVDEVVYGLSKKQLTNKLAWFRQFCIDKADIVEIDDGIARWSGAKRAALSNRGITITMADSLIAATAHESGLILATRNTKDFVHTNIALFNPFGG